MAHGSSSLLPPISPSLSVSLLLLLLLLLSTVAVSLPSPRPRVSSHAQLLPSNPPKSAANTEGRTRCSERNRGFRTMVLGWALAGSRSCFLVQRPQSHLVRGFKWNAAKPPFFGGGELPTKAEIPEDTHQLHKQHQRRGWIWSNCCISTCHELEPRWLRPSVPVMVCSWSSSWRRTRLSYRNCNTEHQVHTVRNSTHNSSHLSLKIWDMELLWFHQKPDPDSPGSEDIQKFQDSISGSWKSSMLKCWRPMLNIWRLKALTHPRVRQRRNCADELVSRAHTSQQRFFVHPRFLKLFWSFPHLFLKYVGRTGISVVIEGHFRPQRPSVQGDTRQLCGFGTAFATIWPLCWKQQCGQAAGGVIRWCRTMHKMTHSEWEVIIPPTGACFTFWYSESSGLKSLLTIWNSMLKWGSRWSRLTHHGGE